MKSFFFVYNYKTNNGWEIHSFTESVRITGWSLYYDMVTVALVSLPFFFFALLPLKRTALVVTGWIAVLLTVLAFLLNLADIFYFSFHRQRADADLLYVLRNPYNYSGYAALLAIAGIVIFCCVAAWYFWKQYRKLADEKIAGINFPVSFLLLAVITASLFTGGSKKMIPARPLTDISAVQLPLAQNSFHTFLYSLYRSRESVIPSKMYMTIDQQKELFTIDKMNSNASVSPKNIVLFIMESVPYEFFDSSSRFKPALPFLDSLRTHSTYYSNAFSYSYNSNKGITAILTGVPTITDIPLYHSGFSSIRKTAVGSLLAQKGYSSSFFIGDNYDDFGFAKCCNWTGIQHYYCMEDIPGYKQMEKHSMGLQDEYVLNFMQQKVQTTKAPFFSSFYNISTHYPNDLTSTYKAKLADRKLSPAMKSMMYYDACLAAFFKEAAREKWFANTVFIFCSDHWASPDADNSKNDMVNSFRIPVMIFDPSVNTATTITNTVSQLDIMNTVLAYAGIKAPQQVTSYGQSLMDSIPGNRVVFTKINNAVYQAINENYVLGFNAEEGKRLYCYQYKTDVKRADNIPFGKNPSADSLELIMKAFLQTAYLHYKSK